MCRDEAENVGVPRREQVALVFQVRILAARNQRTSKTRLRNRRFDERAEVSTAGECVLDLQSTVETEFAGPLGVDLALEIEDFATVSDVSGCDEESKGDPGEQAINGKEGTVVEE